MDKFIYFVVKMPLPDDYTRELVRDYVRDAVRSWSGQFHPEDGLFQLSCDATVRHFNPKTEH